MEPNLVVTLVIIDRSGDGIFRKVFGKFVNRRRHLGLLNCDSVQRLYVVYQPPLI
jgi:hypothetical protein